MRTYTCTFDRIGRDHNVDPLIVEADNLDNLDDLAEHVYQYARPLLASRDVDVVVGNDGPGEDTGHGHIFCGFHTGGTFTITAGRPDVATFTCRSCDGPLLPEDSDRLCASRSRAVDEDYDPTPCCPDPGCGGNPCTFPGYAANH
jgi:hypothetical protein